MRKVLLAAVAVLIAGPALAGTMDNTYGNTVTVTNAKGEVSTLLFEKDGTYVAKGMNAEGKAVEGGGTWAIKDGKYCSTPKAVEGQPAPAEACSEFVEGKNVGDKWEQKDANNETITVEIKAGR